MCGVSVMCLCVSLCACCEQILDNMCGVCTDLGNGAFRIEAKEGLRFGGKSFDDNEIGKGTMQARNICALAKYGNKGTVTKFPNKDSAGYSNWAVQGQVHWFGNCGEGGCATCTGAAPFKSGQDWLNFATGNIHVCVCVCAYIYIHWCQALCRARACSSLSQVLDCMYVYTCIHYTHFLSPYIYLCTYTYSYIHMYMYMYMNIYTHIYTHVNMYIYIYIYIHL